MCTRKLSGRREDGSSGLPGYGPRRKLLATNIKVGMRITRGTNSLTGLPLHVEDFMWALTDARCVLNHADKKGAFVSVACFDNAGL